MIQTRVPTLTKRNSDWHHASSSVCSRGRSSTQTQGFGVPVDAQLRDERPIQRVPLGFQDLAGVGSRSSPSWSRAVPPGTAVLAHDPKPTMGCGRPRPSGCNREDAEGSSALVEVKPVRVTPNDDEAACRARAWACLSVVSPPPARPLARRRGTRGSLGPQHRRPREPYGVGSDGPPRRLQGLRSRRRGTRRVPVRAQEELGLGDVPAVIPEHEGARAEAMAAVPAEGRASERPGNAVHGQSVAALEDAHGDDRVRADLDRRSRRCRGRDSSARPAARRPLSEFRRSSWERIREPRSL